MKSKKKLGPQDNQSKFTIDVNIPANTKSDELLNLHNEFSRRCSESEKILALNKVVAHIKEDKYKNDDDEEFINHLIHYVFEAIFRIQQKNPLWKCIIRSLEIISTKFPNLYFMLVKKFFEDESRSILEVVNKLVLLSEKKELIISPLEIGFSSEIYQNVFETSVKCLTEQWNLITSSQKSTSETNDIFHLVHQVVRSLTAVLECTKSSDFYSINYSSDAARSLSRGMLKIVSAEVTPLDLRISCGLLLTHIMLKDNDFLVIFEKALSNKPPFDNIGTIGILSVFHGLLCVISGEQLLAINNSESSQCENDKELCSKLLDRICHTINTAQIGFVTVFGARILNLLVIKLQDCFSNRKDIDQIVYHKYSIHSKNSRKIQDALWLLWNHYLDCVKHIARETLTAFVKLQMIINKEQSMSYFQNLSYTFLRSLNQKLSSSALTYLVPFVGVCPLLESDPEMINILLNQLSDPFHSTRAANLLEALFTKHYSEVESNEWFYLWFSYFFRNFSEQSLVYGFESLLGKLLLIGKDTVRPISMLVNKEILNNNELCLLIICTKLHLKYSRKLSQDNEIEIKNDIWKDILPYKHLNDALTRGDETLCILGFSLISESPKSTELFNEMELKLVLSILKQNIVSQNPSFRQKLVQNIKKVLNRIKCGIFSKFKKFPSIENDFQKLKNIHKEFLCDLFSYLKSNLFVGANYSRKSISLFIFEPLFDLLEEESFLYLKDELFVSELVDSLIICLSDSYEVNKTIVLKLLIQINNGTKTFLSKSKLDVLLDSSWMLASSSKPPDSMTASYLLIFILSVIPIGTCTKNISSLENRRLVACQHILEKIEVEYNVAKISILKASISGPMYGLLLCLRNLVSELKEEEIKGKELIWRKLFQEIVKICSDIAFTSLEIVRNVSPEGFLPVEEDYSYNIYSKTTKGSFSGQECGELVEMKKDLSEEELIKAQGIAAQMVLLCGWRSIKEISLMYGLLVNGTLLFPNTLKLFSVEEVKTMGNILMTLLIETKHRGAFEQTYNGFEMVCNRLWKCSDKEMNELPLIWLNDTLKLIQCVEENTRLCATRRSAGIPFIIQAIVSTEPTITHGSSLKNTMNTLLTLATSDSELETRIHALNILRALYRETRIGEEVLPYVSDGVKVALSGYKIKSWSLRNSSSLMFSSIVTRMFGVKKSQEDLHSKNAVSALVFFKRYPELYDFILENLNSSAEDMKNGDLSVATFPTLLILARFAPPSSDGFSTSIPLAPFIPYVLKFFGSPVFQLRYLASKALIPLISSTTSLLSVTENLCASMCFQDQNHLHGALLCLTQIINSFSITITSSDELRVKMMKLYQQVMWVAYETNHCYFTRSYGIDLFKLIVVDNLFPSMNIKSLTASCFALLLNTQNEDRHIPGKYLAVRSATDFFLTVHQKYKIENITPFLQLIDLPSSEIQLITLKHISSFDKFTSNILTKKLFSLLTIITDSECWMLCCDIIHNTILHFNAEDCQLYKKELDDVFNFVFYKIKKERSDHVIATSLRLAGIVLQVKIKYLENFNVEKWVQCMETWANVECSSTVRLVVAGNLSKVLPILHSKVEGLIETRILDVLIEFLVDDDADIREIASKGCGIFLKNYASEEQEFEIFSNTIIWSRNLIAEKMFYYLASQGSHTHFTCLVTHALKEELPEVFGLSQEEDRAFDKGETKVLKEDILISKMASESIIKVYERKGSDYLLGIQLMLDLLEDILLLPFPKLFDEDNGRTVAFCSIPQFLTILKREIIFILDVFKELLQKSPFKMRNFDVWVGRLAKRAFIWNALKNLGNEAFEEAVLQPLQLSVIKPTIFNSILNCLS